jgi:ABC-type ATPase involved in cell division
MAARSTTLKQVIDGNGAVIEVHQVTLADDPSTETIETCMQRILNVQATFAEAPGADKVLCATHSGSTVTITSTGDTAVAVDVLVVGYR